MKTSGDHDQQHRLYLQQKKVRYSIIIQQLQGFYSAFNLWVLWLEKDFTLRRRTGFGNGTRLLFVCLHQQILDIKARTPKFHGNSLVKISPISASTL